MLVATSVICLDDLSYLIGQIARRVLALKDNERGVLGDVFGVTVESAVIIDSA